MKTTYVCITYVYIYIYIYIYIRKIYIYNYMYIIFRCFEVLILRGVLHNSNSSQEQLRKMSQLSVLRRELNLRFRNAGAMLLPLSYRGS